MVVIWSFIVGPYHPFFGERCCISAAMDREGIDDTTNPTNELVGHYHLDKHLGRLTASKPNKSRIYGQQRRFIGGSR